MLAGSQRVAAAAANGDRRRRRRFGATLPCRDRTGSAPARSTTSLPPDSPDDRPPGRRQHPPAVRGDADAGHACVTSCVRRPQVRWPAQGRRWRGELDLQPVERLKPDGHAPTSTSRTERSPSSTRQRHDVLGVTRHVRAAREPSNRRRRPPPPTVGAAFAQKRRGGAPGGARIPEAASLSQTQPSFKTGRPW